MKLLIQGMRRSGTTIVFDLLDQDERFDAWYEPFSITRTGVTGGGSGVQDVDFAARVLERRRTFCAEHPEVGGPGVFNWGAPREPRLELEPDLPPFCVEYLRGMLEGAEDVLIKFVRLYEKLAVLRRLAPDSRLIHVVRDPRAVVASQMGASDPARAARFADERAFFHRKGATKLWASRALSELLLESPAYRGLRAHYDPRRILLVWRHVFRRTHDDARRLFGADHLLLRHEDLAARPAETIERIYEFLGISPPRAVFDFAARRIRPARPPLHAESAGWRKAFEKVGMHRELEEAGYGDLL